MKGINYKKILKQLIEEYPHQLDNIEKVINDANKNGGFVHIEFSEIIKSNVWNSEEKARLLTFFGYNKLEHDMSYIDEYKNKSNMKDYLYTIKYDILSGFEALMKIYKDIESHYDGLYISKDDSYRNIFNAVINNCKGENKIRYIKAILDNLTDEDIKRLIAPYYEGHYIGAVHNESIFINIIASKDLNLIRKYMNYIDNINMYLSEAVATGDIEIVKLFLEKGANINYLTDEVILGRLTPLKTAIVNNDYEMAKFLIGNGADVDLQVNSNNFINRLNNYQIDIFDRWHHIKPVNEEDKDAKQLKYIRTSLPLEYAIKLREKSDIYYNCFNVYFNGGSYNFKNQLLVDMDDISEQVKHRRKIVDLIFDKLEDKTTINFSDLIGFTFISNDLEKFKKYSKYAIENNYQIDFDFLFKLYFDFYLDQDKKMAISFLDLIEKYDKNNDIYLRLFDYYVNSKIKHFNEFYINDFNKELLNRISAEKRKRICLIPYCKDIDTLKHLISLGFDVNQVDENGRNILFYLLCNRARVDDLDNREIELFNYLLNIVNLSMKDNNNKTVLYYAMQRFDTKDEHQYARKDWIGTRSNLEKAVALLISRMPKQDVCNDDIKKVLEQRLKCCSDFGEKIHLEYVYQHHKELFNALINKGFALSDKVLNDIFAILYSKEACQKEINNVDMGSTLDFLYQKLDYNLEIQEIDIEQQFKNLIFNIDNQDITFDEFVKSMDNFNNQIISLNHFYENNIKKRFNPEKYLQYAKERHNTIYENLNSYLSLIIIKGIRKFGNGRLVDILNCIPNYDINSYIVDGDIGLNYWSYAAQISGMNDVDEEGNPVYGNEHFEADNVYDDYNENIVFTGGLMQYAILIDDLPMVQLLQERGASLKFLVDGKDHTWDYVNSYTMLSYLESVVGKKKYSSLDEEEKKYYLDLLKKR